MSNKNRPPSTLGHRQSGAVQIREERYSGILPLPDHFRAYNEVLPGSADRIMQMAESQSKHRQSLETRVIKSDTMNSRLGLIFGFIIGLAGIAGAYYLIAIGKTLPGSLAGIITLGALVGTFVYGSKQRRAERAARQASEQSS